MIIKMHWKAWHGDLETELEFPEAWEVQTIRMSDAPCINQDLILQRIRHPLGAPSLKELASRASKAAIVVEDITRPTPTNLVLPTILLELQSGGLNPEKVEIIVGLGAHATMPRPLLIKKLGKEVVESCRVIQHNPYRDLVRLGTTQRGTPVDINRFYIEADLRLAVGGITPHALVEFGGGVKTVSVGVAGIETLKINHNRAWSSEAEGIAPVEINECLADMEEIAHMAKLEFIINGIVNSQRKLAGLLAGEPKQTHRVGVDFARGLFSTQLPRPVDIIILNAYPKDTDLVQSANALNAVGLDVDRVLKKNGTIVIFTASPEGAGIHYLGGIGIGRPVPYDKVTKFRDHQVIIFSPNLSYPEVRQQYPHDTLVFSSWQETLLELQNRHGEKPSAAVFPCASLQIPTNS